MTDARKTGGARRTASREAGAPAAEKKTAEKKPGVKKAAEKKAAAPKAAVARAPAAKKAPAAKEAPAARAAATPAAAASADAVLFETLWNTLPIPALLLDEQSRILAANNSAELYFSNSATLLNRMSIDTFFGVDSHMMDLISQVRRGMLSLSEYGMQLAVTGREPSLHDVQIAPLHDGSHSLLVLIQPRSVAAAMNRSLSSHSASRRLSGLSSMLAHEIKNPLSGISGAAQLLEMTLGDGEQELLQLIQEEVERIRSLVDRMDSFGESGPLERQPVNIHDVLDQARRSASAGFARHIRFREIYDPSLPPVPGDRDQLLQAIANLVKNAAEAAPRQGGEIVLRTAYRPGVKIRVAGGAREQLPLEVSVIDNGPGVPEDLRPFIFDPFVTSKSTGSGLGLALVGKIVSEHGGVIECLRQNERTVFRMLFPVWSERATAGDQQQHMSGDGGGSLSANREMAR